MSARETARPMPDPAPVTTAITPATLLSLDPPIIVDASAPWAPPGSIGRASSGWTLWSEADRHPAVIHGGEAPRESVDPGLALQAQRGDDRAVVGAGDADDVEALDAHAAVDEDVVDGDGRDAAVRDRRPGPDEAPAGGVGGIEVAAGEQAAQLALVERGVEVA